MTFAVYQVIKYILPARTVDTAASLKRAYGVDVESPTAHGFAAQIGVDAALDFIEHHLEGDGSNQEQCYKSTVPDHRVDEPVLLDSLETVNNSRVNRIDLYRWADLRITGLVGNRPFLTPHTGKWRRVGLENPEQLIPTTSPLPSHEQLDAEMGHLARLQKEFLTDHNRKVQVSFWADGPKSTLPPGHWQVSYTRLCISWDSRKS